MFRLGLLNICFTKSHALSADFDMEMWSKFEGIVGISD